MVKNKSTAAPLILIGLNIQASIEILSLYPRDNTVAGARDCRGHHADAQVHRLVPCGSG
jgi:hypothetical protein